MSYQMNTKNHSFYNTHILLKKLGLKNNKFFLKLFDKRLENINPHAKLPDGRSALTREEKNMVYEECNRNVWYLIREVIRVPLMGSGGGTSHFFLDMASLASFYLSLLNLNYAVIKPRQTGKTLAEVIWDAICVNFYYRQSKMGVIVNKGDLVKKNIYQVQEILDLLPDYLQFHNYAYDKNSNRVPRRKDTAKKMSYGHLLYKNHIVGQVSGTTHQQAENCGRGESFISLWFDEPAHMVYNHLAIGSAMKAFSKVSDLAKRTGTPHKVAFTLTPGDTKTPHGKFMKQFIEDECAPFVIELFDRTYDEITTYLKKNGRRDVFKIQFSYAELGYDEKWLEKQRRESTDEREFRMGILLEWLEDVSNNPFGVDVLMILDTLTANVKYKTLLFKDTYSFKIYEGFEKCIAERRKIVVGCDVAAGRGGNRDSSTMVGVDSVTTEIVFTFKNNTINPDEFADLIEAFILERIPNSLWIIERNSIGSGVLSKLKNSPVVNNLYYAPMSKRQLDDLEIADKDGKFLYGIWNMQSIREILYGELLHTRVNKYAKLIKSRDIYNEIKTLVDKGGRIDHALDAHDDLLIAFMFTLFLLFKDPHIHERYGIRRPSPIPDIEELISDTKPEDIIVTPKTVHTVIDVNKDKDTKSNKGKFDNFWNKHTNDAVESILKQNGVNIPETNEQGMYVVNVNRRRR